MEDRGVAKYPPMRGTVLQNEDLSGPKCQVVSKFGKPPVGVINVALFSPEGYFEKIRHNKEYMIREVFRIALMSC